MMVQIELWNLILLLLAFFGCVGAFGKILLSQVEKRLNRRFIDQDKVREIGATALRETIERHTAQGEKTATQVKTLEREFLEWKAEMPLIYVRREDYIRGQAVLEAKQDALYSETKVVQMHLEGLKAQMKGNSNG